MRLSILAAAACAVLVPLAASSAEITIPATVVGWYNASGHHEVGNPNTLTGSLGEEYRSFYVWDIPSLEGRRIVSARLEFQMHYSLGAENQAPQTGRIVDVKPGNLSDIAAQDGNGRGQAIFRDLGTGYLYGTLSVPASINADYSIYATLDKAALRAITMSQGGQFGAGMINVTPGLEDYDYFLVSSGSFPSVQNLILDVRPARSSGTEQ
jgi:opacity protein-like surface antigen